MNRREMLKLTTSAVVGTSIFGMDALASEKKDEGRKKKALIIGAHPDDPETGCGGTMMILRAAGYEVVSVYMTKGEAGIKGKTHKEAATIRVAEATQACKILDVRPIFLSQIDGNSQVDQQRYIEMREVISAEKPDIVFTHWPIDSHADHRVCSTLVYDAWRRLGYTFELYYFEVMTGIQSQLFNPTDWVDISSVYKRKEEATFCHKSQEPETWYASSHGNMEIFRGMEFRCNRAEAFIHLNRDSKIY